MHGIIWSQQFYAWKLHQIVVWIHMVPWMELHGIAWNCMELHGIVWNCMWRWIRVGKIVQK